MIAGLAIKLVDCFISYVQTLILFLGYKVERYHTGVQLELMMACFRARNACNNVTAAMLVCYYLKRVIRY